MLIKHIGWTILLLVSALIFSACIIMPLALGYWYMFTGHESFSIAPKWWIGAFVGLITCGGLLGFAVKKFVNVKV